MTYAPRPATAPTRMPDLTAGLCRTRPDLPWHPDGHTPAGLLREALNMCCACPAIGDCLDWGLNANEQGIWGGTTDLMRQQIRHNRRRTGT